MKKEKINSANTFSGSDRKKYWEEIYDLKKPTEVGWYQAKPELSIQFIEEPGFAKEAKIIDVGGGDSLLVDHLMELGYSNLTVLDVSNKAIERAKLRLGHKADLVKWICSDVTDFIPEETYDLWHDRACFHFLTKKKEIKTYCHKVAGGLKTGGVFVLGTFSKTGPKKCSGLDIHQYDAMDMKYLFSDEFDLIHTVESVHLTPALTKQNYVFCNFKKKLKI
jgi:2-polyprenyl-3-methyl-5-hydroxy-6-metoxy-1,4-benzoquinol methylase